MALIAFVGRLGKDPEYDHEKKSCKFTIAEDKRSEESAPNWWNCTVKGHNAEFCSQYLFKGRLVYIEGHVDQRVYSEKTYYNVWVDRVTPLDRPTPKKEAPATTDEYDPFADDGGSAA